MSLIWANMLFAQKQIDSLKILLDAALVKKDSNKIFYCYNEIGKYYYQEEQNRNAISHFKMALSYISTKNEPKLYNRMGTMYWRVGNYDSAMYYYIKSARRSEKSGDKKTLSTAFNNIGFIYAEYDNLVKTLEYYQKALKLRISLNYEKGIGFSYTSIGRVYMEMDSLDKAINYHNRAIVYFEKFNMQSNKANAINSIGNVYIKKGNLKKALDKHLQAKTIRLEINDIRGLSESCKNLAKIYLKKRMNKKAEDAINEGIRYAESLGSLKMQKHFYFQLYELKVIENNTKAALDNYIKYTEVKDTLFSIENKNRIDELEIRYETEKKAQQIKYFKVKDSLSDELIAKQQISIVFVLVLSLVLLIGLSVFLMLWLQKRSAYRMLIQKNVELANLDEDDQPIPELAENHNEKTNIPNEQKIMYNLLTIIEENKYFLNPDCSIENLAKKIGTNRQYISQLINSRFHTNFNNFINKYRIKEARKLLIDSDYDKYTIEAIALKSGFRNRTSFNNAFKHFTGLTPSFFKKNRQKL